MKLKILIIITLTCVVAFLIYELYRIESHYLKPKVVPIEKQVIKEVFPRISFNQATYAAIKSVVYAKVLGEDIGILHVSRQDRGKADTSYLPIFIKGVNFGPAIPGTYPADFAPKREDYMRWFKLMKDAGFNAIRIYTVFPANFYSALSEFNMKNSTDPLYLLQGIWAPVPFNEDYLSNDYILRMKVEIERTVDAIYGVGKHYVDVAKYTIGFIFGREWEPDGVLKTNSTHTNETSYSGNFISLPKGFPMEVWLAMMLDHIQTYEAVKYFGLHPVSFVNWLTLDPLFHNSEYIEFEKVREYDNDLLTINPSNFYRTEINRAGYFAAYHILSILSRFYK